MGTIKSRTTPQNVVNTRDLILTALWTRQGDGLVIVTGRDCRSSHSATDNGSNMSVALGNNILDLIENFRTRNEVLCTCKHSILVADLP